MKKFEFLEHTADIKLMAYGRTLEEAMKNSILATANSMFSEKVKGKLLKKINIRGKDYESLLYNLLDEIIFLFDADNFLVSKVKNLKIIKSKNGFNLKAELSGDDSKNYRIKEHIKSVTYSEMEIKKEKNKFIIQVVLDV